MPKRYAYYDKSNHMTNCLCHVNQWGIISYKMENSYGNTVSEKNGGINFPYYTHSHYFDF